LHSTVNIDKIRKIVFFSVQNFNIGLNLCTLPADALLLYYIAATLVKIRCKMCAYIWAIEIRLSACSLVSLLVNQILLALQCCQTASNEWRGV